MGKKITSKHSGAEPQDGAIPSPILPCGHTLEEHKNTDVPDAKHKLEGAELERLLKIFHEIASGTRRGFIYMAAVDKLDDHHEKADGIIFANRFPKLDMIANLIDNMNINPLEMLQLIAEIKSR